MLFHWKLPSFDTWHGSGLLTCEFLPWHHSAHPARQFCKRRWQHAQDHDIQISWSPGNARTQQSTALSPWFYSELTGSIACESHCTGATAPSGRSTLVPLHCISLHRVEVPVCPDLLQSSLNYNPPCGIKTTYISYLKMSLSCITAPSKLSTWRHTAISEGSCVPPLHMTVLIQVLLKALEGLPWKILALLKKTGF